MRKTMLLVSVLATAMALPAAQAQAPLSVRVLSPELFAGRSIRFEISQPAYVAAFMVYPGAGVRLIYPETTGPEQLWSQGYHNVSLLRTRYDNDFYNATLGPIDANGPRYLYIVASAYPLDVARFVQRPMFLQNTIGFASARSFSVDTALDALTSNALSLGSDDTWDADSYILWSGLRGYNSNAMWYADAYTPWSDFEQYNGTSYVAYSPLRIYPCYTGFSTYIPVNYYSPSSCTRVRVRPPQRTTPPQIVRRDSSNRHAVARGSTPSQPVGPIGGLYNGGFAIGAKNTVSDSAQNVRNNAHTSAWREPRDNARSNAQNILQNEVQGNTQSSAQGNIQDVPGVNPANNGGKTNSDSRTYYRGKRSQEFFRNQVRPSPSNPPNTAAPRSGVATPPDYSVERRMSIPKREQAAAIPAPTPQARPVPFVHARPAPVAPVRPSPVIPRPQVRAEPRMPMPPPEKRPTPPTSRPDPGHQNRL